MDNLQAIYTIICESNFAVSIDTRKISQGDVFFALSGENFDGNKFAEEALEKGASGVIIDNPKFCYLKNSYLVNDTLKALQNLANYHKKQSQFKVIALTGSNGKTTTKELLFEVLSTQFKTKATTGNLNNHIGVPLTLLSTPSSTEYLVLEMGANHIGEIKQLSKIADPDYGLITNIGNAHLEGFGGIEGVLKGKTELFDYLYKNQKIIFFNSDDKKLKSIRSGFKGNTQFYSIQNYEVNIEKNLTPLLTLNLKIDNQLYSLNTKLSGDYNVYNIVAALTVGDFFNIPAESMVKAIEKYVPNNFRSQIIKSKTNTLYVDCYNANPSSMKVSIDNFDANEKGVKTFILGEMKELGELSKKFHQEIINHVNEIKNAENIFLIGKEFSSVQFPSNRFVYFESTSQLLESVNFDTIREQSILLKGSRYNQLEQLLPHL